MNHEDTVKHRTYVPCGGLKLDYNFTTFKDADGEPQGALALLGGGGPCWILDMPLSFVGDTLFLPFDLLHQHRVKAYEERRRRHPPDPDPLAGWRHRFGKKPDPAIIADYKSYIEQLPDNQKSGLIVNDHMVRLFEDGHGAQAMEIVLFLKGVEWKHVLLYDQSNRRIKVMKYTDGHSIP